MTAVRNTQAEVTTSAAGPKTIGDLIKAQMK
jgi:hypothetical protein